MVGSVRKAATLPKSERLQSRSCCSLAANEASKESHVSNGGLMTALDGSAVKTEVARSFGSLFDLPDVRAALSLADGADALARFGLRRPDGAARLSTGYVRATTVGACGEGASRFALRVVLLEGAVAPPRRRRGTACAGRSIPSRPARLLRPQRRPALRLLPLVRLSNHG